MARLWQNIRAVTWYCCIIYLFEWSMCGCNASLLLYCNCIFIWDCNCHKTLQ